MSQLPVLSSREVIGILGKMGFEEVRQRGSHKQRGLGPAGMWFIKTRRVDTMEAQDIRIDIPSASTRPTSSSAFSVPATVGRRIGEAALAGMFGVWGVIWLSPPSHDFIGYRWFFVPFFGLMSLHFLVRAFDRRPRLTVDEDGVTDRTALLLGPLRLGWEDIADITTRQLADRVGIVVRDLDDMKKRLGTTRRVWIWLRRLMGQRTISITPTLLGMSTQELESGLRAGLYDFERRRLLEARDELAETREAPRPSTELIPPGRE
jgi:hypothetical protein